MKKILLCLSIILILTACGKSKEEKIEELVIKETKSMLYFPESFDLISFECDSLFTQILTKENVMISTKIFDYVDKSKFRYGEEKDKMIEKSMDLFVELVNTVDEEPKFYGYAATIRFRAKNNNGQVLIKAFAFVLNKEGTKIVESFDLTSDNVIKFSQMINLIKTDLGNEYTEDDMIEICKNVKSKYELILEGM